MKNIKITDDMIDLKEAIPSDFYPKRYAISTNLLCNIDSNSEKGLMLLNIDPVIWNNYYPFYSTINAHHTFKAENYFDLSNEFDEFISNFANSDQRLEKACKEFSERYDCGVINVEPQQAVAPEKWLKYSKAEYVWTYYKMEFYIVQKIDNPENILKEKGLRKTFVDLNKLEEFFMHDGIIDGVPVVDNMIGLLHSEKLIDQLKQHVINIST